MANEVTLGIAGAETLIGAELLNLVGERALPCNGIRLFMTADEVGEHYQIGDHEVVAEDVEDADFSGVTIMLCALAAEEAAPIVSRALDAGSRVIDLSGAFSLGSDARLHAHELNPAGTGNAKLVSCPHSIALALASTLFPVAKEVGITRITASTYQAVSSAGQDAMDELFEQTRSVFTQQLVSSEVFAHQIAFNCIPQIDSLSEDGFTKEEERIERETKRLLLEALQNAKSSESAPAIDVTAVRVPVFHGDGCSVSVETKSAVSLEKIAALLASNDLVTVIAGGEEELPTSTGAVASDAVMVARLRQRSNDPCRFHFWLAVDCIRTGSALNAVKLLEDQIAVLGQSEIL
jgi:aspartate-semialdehyde dehydrogenase